MTQYRINKVYELSLIVEAPTAAAAFAISSGIDLDVRANVSNPKILAISCKYTGDSTTHRNAVTQEKVAARAQAKALEVAEAKAKTAASRARNLEIKAMLAGRPV